MPILEKTKKQFEKVTGSKQGQLFTYGIAWLLGVPVTILLIVYLLRGH